MECTNNSVIIHIHHIKEYGGVQQFQITASEEEGNINKKEWNEWHCFVFSLWGSFMLSYHIILYDNSYMYTHNT